MFQTQPENISFYIFCAKFFLSLVSIWIYVLLLCPQIFRCFKCMSRDLIVFEGRLEWHHIPESLEILKMLHVSQIDSVRFQTFANNVNDNAIVYSVQFSTCYELSFNKHNTKNKDVKTKDDSVEHLKLLYTKCHLSTMSSLGAVPNLSLSPLPLFQYILF